MKFIQNLSIRNKLLLVSLVPMAALLYFLATDVSDKIDRHNNLRRVHNYVLEIERIADIIYSVQEERGYAIGYVSSNGREEKSEMIDQRMQTDKAIAALSQLFKEQKKARQFETGNTLGQIRNGIDQFNLDLDTMANAYTRINNQLLDEVNANYRSAQDPEIRNLTEAHYYLLNGIGFLSQLRMHLHLTILNKGFRGNEFATFASLKGKYELKLDRYYKNTTPAQRAAYDSRTNYPAVIMARAMIDSVFNNPGAAVTLPVNTWRVNTSTFLNELKGQEDLSTVEIRQLADERLAAVSAALIRSVTVVIAVIMLIVVLLILVIRSIVKSITVIKTAADRIVLGETAISIPVTSKDEIGKLAASFNRLVDVSKEHTIVADTIARGDYSPVIKVRSDADLLSKALKNMKQSLQKLSQENEARTWVLTGAAALNNILRGDKLVTVLAQQVVNMLTPYLKAQIGAIYIAENDQLVLAGSYAYSFRKENANSIQIGEGLVGQAASEKKPILFTDIPEDYIKINSGLGKVTPKNILVYPFMFDSYLKGVLEIGTVHAITDSDRQLLKIVSESIGIAINSAQARTLQKELLEETQRQSEELEAQQEELKQTNEQLNMQTAMLERSEAELKAQQEELQQTNEELEEKAYLLEEQKEKLELAKIEVEDKARELESTSKYKSEFLANMSHELRTPLNSILILSQLLTENKNKSLSPKDIEYATNIYNSGSDLLTLINEILDLSKVEAGKIELEISEVPLNELINSLEQLFTEVAKSRNIGFSIQGNEDKFRSALQTDPQRLEQILRNLLSNAFKFTERDGEVSVLIDVQQPSATLSNENLRKLPEVVVFSVSDTGIGIPESKQGIIFEAFQQADGSNKRKYGGTGLGLSISRELAGALGGEIHLKSEEGKGSTFTLFLPLKFDTANVTKGERNIEIRKPAGNTVLPVVPPIVSSAQKQTANDPHPIMDQDKPILIIEDDVTFALTNEAVHGAIDRMQGFINRKLKKLLVVEDNPQQNKAIRELIGNGDVRSFAAYTGQEAYNLMQDERFDCIIIDLGLPDMTGIELMEKIKKSEQLNHIPIIVYTGQDMNKEEARKLEKLANTVVLKTSDSKERLLDETALFLHAVESKLPGEKQQVIRKLHRTEEILKNKKALIVDDDMRNIYSLTNVLEEEGMKCLVAENGKVAIDTLEKQPDIDIVLMDIMMPEMDGFEATMAIRRKHKFNKLPIIALTAKAMKGDREKCLEAGMSDYVSKPVNIEQLLSLMRVWLYS
ncbi:MULTISPECIES: response regulator [Niastella]|uniref:histidine kinase n=1 Tax=Niastella soli TaxID=2821487 RepID=A0ABS3Z4P9_9BACT|nr:response regulator [Niastella soli]MBO9205146.1 response regulator [Niastella soli]